MLIETLSQNLRKARITNATDNGFPSRVPTATEPTGTGNNAAQATASAVFNLGIGGLSSQNAVFIKPFGVGSNTNTFSLRLIGWNYVLDPSTPEDRTLAFWDPTVLVEYACTLTSSVTGVSGSTVSTSNLFPGTMTLTVGNANVSNDLVNPAGTIAAHAEVDLKGFQKLEFTFTTGGSATSCNCLFRLL